MTTIIFLIVFYTPNMISAAQDPLDGWAAPDVELRALDCEPVSMPAARQQFPGQLPDPKAREDYLARRAVVCRERLMPPGLRRPGEEALLFELRKTAVEMAGVVRELPEPDQDRVWMVEVFHPSAVVSHKIGFAVKNALLDLKVKVTDRAPTLAAGDIEVIGQVEAARAYPLACARYAANGALGEGRALLAVAQRNPDSTLLHAGVCIDGAWRWLR